jgi:O-antigen/teichoic acid export membrane protein
MIMLIGSAGVSAINFGYNIVTAHLLGPAEFGHACVAVTLLMLASAITLAFQLLCAKMVARTDSAAQRSAFLSLLEKKAWRLSASLGLALALFAPLVTSYLRLPSRAVTYLLAAAILFYIPLGVKRGAMQGICDFPRLTGNFLLESAVKFLAAVLLIELLLGQGSGTAMLGAVAAITASVVAAYFLPRLGAQWRAGKSALSEACVRAPILEGMQASVFFMGQVLINNIDIVLVKHYFPPREAGIYAGIALVGRVLYFAAWSVVSAMFPIAAGAKGKVEPRTYIVTPLLLVAAVSAVFIAITAMVPHLIIHTAFGSAFHGPYERLLSWYATATALYSLSVVLIAYEMSRKIANTAWLQLVFAGLVMAGIVLFHNTLKQVIVVQIVLMLAMLVVVALPFLIIKQNQAAQLTEAA